MPNQLKCNCATLALVITDTCPPMTPIVDIPNQCFECSFLVVVLHANKAKLTLRNQTSLDMFNSCLFSRIFLKGLKNVLWMLEKQMFETNSLASRKRRDLENAETMRVSSVHLKKVVIFRADFWWFCGETCGDLAIGTSQFENAATVLQVRLFGR